MEEKTTTEAPAETGVEQTLPVETEQAEAVEKTTEQQSEQDTGAKALPDEKLVSFAKGQGIDDMSELTSRELSLLKSAYDNKAEYERNKKRATELEKTMSTMSETSATQVAEATGQDPELLKRIQATEVKMAIRDFYDQNPDARQYDKEMAKIASESGLYGSPEAILKASYAIAVANNQAGVKSQVKREALESLAHKLQAAVPTGSATTPGIPKDKPFGELSIKEMESRLGFVGR